ncbi:hypothetical protein ACP0AK_12130 [Listeria ivanovii]|uniref:Uncharacterized protein n=1 Tax=Listeria ivanovii (strain ATCC BAA-678 / PAM 55) TaxID=881621 RepID=G2ZA74_LISIP|nr:hypothetical protein [Listeria ivanovii]AHI57225.1 hypothetical protein AX25_01720 [Listeria ivanovii WSLC3009]MBC1760274.1 hypothetical protein [Listeria ivanovii]MBK3915328.1 hypothetical protein [Listeria ivanovii subsp. ivanovii]MBK3922456.1 hypothetical protein [Listeria ivanovii subsp. ivanovii]MBK3927616.1 hypothetical protein [Listeria ivanovii subsp. ivanovii]
MSLQLKLIIAAAKLIKVIAISLIVDFALIPAIAGRGEERYDCCNEGAYGEWDEGSY